MKTCSRCGAEKPALAFSRQTRAGKDGVVSLHGQCRQCRTELHADYVKAHPDAIKRNRDKRREKANAASRHWRACHPGYHTNKHRIRCYGVDDAAVRAMLSEQGGKCAICGVQFTGVKRSAHVDHCHQSGAVRGVLCHACNKGLGYFRDNPSSLMAAVEYLVRSRPASPNKAISA